jgi:tetratricopeptide (TPR) repeat protein
MILTFEDNYYYMKDFFKKIVYASMLDNEKTKIHKYLNELYIREESKKLSERIIPISRRLLHSEQYYHYITLKKLQKEFDILEFKSAGLSAQKVKPTDAVIDYLKVRNKPDNAFIEPKREKVLPENDFDIILTEEEKMLLNENISDDTSVSDSPNIEELFENPLMKEKFSDSEVNDAFNKALQFEQDKNYDLALNSYKKAYELSQKASDKSFLAKISNSIGGILNNVNKYDESLKYYENSLNIYKDLNDKKSVSIIYSKIANIYKETFKHESALQCYQKLLSMPEENLEEKLKLEVFSGIAEIYSYREDFENALKYYLEAYEKVKMSDDNKTKSMLLFKIALIYDDLNHSQNALEYYNKSIEKGLIEAPTSHLASSYVNAASIYEETKDKVKAEEYYLKSLDIDSELKNYEDRAQTLSRLASMALESGNSQKALDYYKQELECAKVSGNPYTQASSYLDLGDFYLSENSFEKAIKTYFSARKSIGKEISTDSREKIDRRLRMILNQIGRESFNAILESLKKKN